MSELIQIWSNRDQRFIEAKPCPMPPTWRDWLKHLVGLHGLSVCPSRCLIYQRRRYDTFLWWIDQKPEPAKGREG